LPIVCSHAILEEQAEISVRILIIDDHADTAQSLAVILSASRHNVQVACDGQSGLQAAEMNPPEVVLLDIGLPVMDGWQVAERLRQMRFEHRPTVIALTGYGREEDRNRSRLAGIDFHWTKPVDPGFLEEFLNRLQKARATEPVDSLKSSVNCASANR
jgi:CheY-like chemotaxis protein